MIKRCICKEGLTTENKKDTCCRKTGKLLTLISLGGMIAALICAYFTHRQNKKYKEKIIEMSENFPITPEQEKELAEIRQRECAAAHSPANRQTTEERMAENRITEEE